MLAVSCTSIAEAYKRGFDHGWWKFRIFNAPEVCRQRLLQLYTNPSIVPLEMQFFYGQDTWTFDMLSALPKINHHEPLGIPESLTNYLIVMSSPKGEYLYGGSACSLIPKSIDSGIGLRQRLKEHEKQIAACKQCLENKQGMPSDSLFVHSRAAFGQHFYLEAASFPYVDDRFL